MNEPLDPTNQQSFALAAATGLGETRGMYVAMMLWPLIRDMVLETAVSACEAVALAEDLTREVSAGVPGALSATKAAERCARDVLALMGSR